VDLDPTVATAALYANSFRTLEPYVSSTGLRPHGLRTDAVNRLGPPSAAEEFLVASRLRRRDVEFELSVASYFSEAADAMTRLIGLEQRRGFALIALPVSPALKMTLDEAIRRRRSVRAYTGDALPLAYVAGICRAGCGITGNLAGRDSAPGIAARATPSSGGLYPIDLHIVALRVDGLARGSYVYDPRKDALWQTGEAGVADGVIGAIAAPAAPIQTTHAAALCVLVARPRRAVRKYGERGLRHVLLEAGAIAQQIALACVALGVGSVDSSSIYDDEAHEALGLDGEREAVVHLIVLGIPA
jgi:SagB-type dehydrogenase family enzyme